MANLQLTLIDGGLHEQRQIFDVPKMGATIGRSKECDWILNDTDRFISNKHILIAYTEQRFLLTDLSSNGVYINGSDTAVGKGHTYILQQSDIITLGKFRILVSKLEVQEQADNQDLMSLINSPSASEKPKPEGSSADLSLFDILQGESPQRELTPPQPILTPTAKPVAADIPPVAATPSIHAIPDDWDLQIESQSDSIEQPVSTRSYAEATPENVVKPAQNIQPEPAINAPAKALGNNAPEQVEQRPGAMSETNNKTGDDSFFNHLYDSLGLPAEYRDTTDKIAFANDLVQILNTSTQGIMALLAGRSVFKQESRLNMTMIKPQSNNPIKFSLDPSDTLEMLLVKKKPGYMSAQASYSEAMNDIQAHQMAFLSGLQATLCGVLEALEPASIEQEAEKNTKSFIGIKSHSQKWKSYAEKQADLKQQVSENLTDVLSTYFSPAYEQYIKNAGETNE